MKQIDKIAIAFVLVAIIGCGGESNSGTNTGSGGGDGNVLDKIANRNKAIDDQSSGPDRFDTRKDNAAADDSMAMKKNAAEDSMLSLIHI